MIDAKDVTGLFGYPAAYGLQVAPADLEDGTRRRAA
jgi:hypothetical protein